MSINRKNQQAIMMPQLAESMVDGTLSKWLKNVGDRVEEYEPVCEIITDKVTSEIPSTFEGILSEQLAAEGETIDVGAPICMITTAESTERSAKDVHEQKAENVRNASGQEDTSMKNRYSPAVRTIAEEHGIDLSVLTGTGRGGRITRKDVLAYLDQDRKEQTEQLVKTPLRSSGLHLNVPAPVKPEPKVEQVKQNRSRDNEYYLDVTPVRNTIATRMRQSVSEIPHAWTMIEVDVTNLVLLRNRMKQDFIKQEGINLTYLSFVIKAVVNAIKDYPILNSVWAVDKIIVKRDINISLAVGTEESVYVPVIQQADQRTIAGLAREIHTLTEKARSGTLTPQDMLEGTFTVNNTGSFGSILSRPIINYPQAANLTFESIVKKPVVIDDMIAVRSMANICLSLDHRILDGVICGRFLQRVKENIEGYGPQTQLY